MKELIKEYKNIFCNFLKDKRYLVTVILVAILSYGFTITHYSIGIDDLCLDRYVSGTYMLAENRWGTWLVYNILHITKFSPFWLDFIVTVLMVLMATLICTAMKKVLKDKTSIWTYVIFASIFLSNPIIGPFFIYQSTNLTVVLSNIIATISAILVIENAFTMKKKWIYLLNGIILTFAFAMYEACVQSFFAILFALLLLKFMVDKINTKEVLKVVFQGIISVILGLVGYYATGKVVSYILIKIQMDVKDYADHSIIWLNPSFLQYSLEEKIEYLQNELIIPLVVGITNYLPLKTLILSSLTAIIFGIKTIIKEKNCTKLFLILGVILSSFILIALKGTIMYRVQFSWTIMVAFICMYIFLEVNKTKILKYIASLILIWIIIIQTNNLNDFFYNDYKRYELEKEVSHEIARDIKNCKNYKNKTIFYMADGKNKNPFIDFIDNKNFTLQWGTAAFNELRSRNNKIYK